MDFKAGKDPGKDIQSPEQSRGSPVCRESAKEGRPGRGLEQGPKALQEREVGRGIGVSDRRARNWLRPGARAQRGWGPREIQPYQPGERVWACSNKMAQKPFGPHQGAGFSTKSDS